MSDFDTLATTWDENPMHFKRSSAIAEKLVELIPIDKKMNALEFGAGTGILSILLSDHFRSISMVDNSKEMVRVIQEKLEKLAITHLVVHHINIENEDIPGKFDFIYSQMVFHHIRDIDHVLGKFHSLLNDGGYIAIADLYTEDGSFHEGDPNVHFGFDPEELVKKLQQRNFSSIHYEECFVIEKSINAENKRNYPVFLLVARKA